LQLFNLKMDAGASILSYGNCQCPRSDISFAILTQPY
jgi:hypothetical protein